tara:strand:- start:27120 stop:27749 length:630 start_codon:yes stop_codon:yes gene_type:complete
MKYSKPKTFEDALSISRRTILNLAKSLEVRSPYVDKDDLISCGMLGLFQCWKKFKPNETTKFSTFAYFRIKGAMLDEVRKNQIHKRNLIEKVKRIENETFDETEETMPMNNVLYMASFKNVSSNDLEVKDQSNKTPMSTLIENEKNTKVKKAISYLANDEQKVLNFRYRQELKLKEVGKRLNLSEARIHQIQREALNKLRDILDEDLAG